MEMNSTSAQSALFGVQFSYLGKVLIPFSLLLFVTALCDVAVPSKLLYILFSVHIITFLLVLTCQSHDLYYVDLIYHEGEMFPYFTHGNGLWYTAYTVLLFSYMIYGMFILVKTRRYETEDVIRKRLGVVILAAVVQFVFYALRLWGIGGSYDLTVLGYTLSGIIIFIGLTRYDLMDTTVLASQFIVDELAEPIIVTDHTNEITYLNNPAKKLFPNYEDDGIAIVSRIMAAKESHSKIELNERIYTPEITDLTYNGVSQGNVYSLIDDTEDIKTAIALRKANETAQNERRRADEANRAKSAFLSNMSHEIRTPMNAIVGMTEILLRDEHSPKTVDYLHNIQRSGDSLLSIINDILDFSKIESGKLDIIEAPYDPYIMLNDLKVIFLTRVGEKSLILDYDIDENLPSTLLGDSLRVRQIIINLMNNAIKFTDEGMVRLSIHVVAQSESNVKLKVSVRDTGQGIREEDLNKLFQSFSQVNSLKNHSKEGSGLGLAICKSLVNLMGGNISVESKYGEGSIFSFDLIQKLVTEEEAAKYKRERNAEKAFKAPMARVLIVDDNEMNITVALGLLEPLEMILDTAVNGQDAIDKTMANHYDLIFMDHMMPVMDGLEATEKLRAIDEDYFRNVPIIALSANAQKESIDAFLASGMNDSVSKPIRMNEICRVLREYLPHEYIQEIDESEVSAPTAATAAATFKQEDSVPFRIEGLDMAEALVNCGNEKLLRKLLADYYRLITPKADLIDKQLAEGDIKNYTIEVHALKNTSRMIGAMELSAAFKELEAFGHDEDVEAIRKRHEDVVAAYRALLPVLEPYSGEVKENLTEISNDDLKSTLKELVEICEALDLDGADKCLEYLRTLALPKKVKALMPDLEALIADVALDKIKEKTDEMIAALG